MEYELIQNTPECIITHVRLEDGELLAQWQVLLNLYSLAPAVMVPFPLNQINNQTTPFPLKYQ